MIGAILARNGASTIIIDSQRHPRFAVGEATIRETTMMIKILAERFDVKELHDITSYVAVTEGVSRRCGMKRHISYAYHETGVPQKDGQHFQVLVPETFEGPEIHYLREDIDTYLAKVAQKHGCDLREGVRIAEISITESGVHAVLDNGETIDASYVIDATGFRSVLADKFGLREQPPRFRSNTRSIFTHMTGVKPYEDCALSKTDSSTHRWSQGTLHHCFDGGWFWIIPFNNGPDPENNLVSVGLQLDNRKFPHDGTPPEEEFWKFVKLFPSVEEHFADAVSARPWISSGERLQYSSSKTVGDRWCMMSHAAGFLDPLFSRGLVLTMRAMLPTAELVLAALQDGDFSAERFAKLDEIQQRTLDNIDAMVEGMYTSWQSFDLFNAFAKFWYSTGVLGFFQIESAYSHYLRTRDRERLRRALYGQFRGSLCSAFEEFQPYFAKQIALIQAVSDGNLAPSEAAPQIMANINAVDFLPPGFNFGDPVKRVGGPFTLEHWKRIQTWGNFESPKSVKESLYSGDGEENYKRFMAKVEMALASDRLTPIRSFIARTNPAIQ
jgi:FADH2 O2-dependent halogenase